jgi:hypothetical protein
LNNTFYNILNRTLQKKGHVSLKAFYQRYAFSFSYEYLRKTFSGERIPEAKKIAEIAVALGLDPHFLQREAAATRLGKKIRQHYRLPPTTQLKHLSEKVRRYRREGETEAKILRHIEHLGKKEKQQLLQYLKFLRNQCRPKRKKGGK